MSDTPRTDDAQWGTGKVTTDFARTLERELTEAKSRIAECENIMAFRQGIINKQELRCVEANKRVAVEREKVRTLRAELTNIAAANPAHWGDEMDQFVPWAQNRARHTLAATEDTP